MHRLLSDKLSRSAITKCFKSYSLQCTDAFLLYNGILSSQVIRTLRRPKVIIRLLKTHLAFAIFPYFLLQIHCLLITDQPEFNTHPQNKTKTEGENVTLALNAVGNPAPTFSWTKDGSVVNTKIIS